MKISVQRDCYPDEQCEFVHFTLYIILWHSGKKEKSYYILYPIQYIIIYYILFYIIKIENNHITMYKTISNNCQQAERYNISILILHCY